MPDPIDLSGRHLYVTGGTGAVGRTLIDRLAHRRGAGDGPRVTVLTRDPAGFMKRFPIQAGHGWLNLVEGDLTAPPSIPAGVSDIIHAAADTHLPDGHADWIDQIVGGTRKMLEAAAAVGAERFLLVSSGAVYGPQPSALERIPEDYHGAPDPLRPGSTYGQAKRMAEQLCTVFRSECGLDTVVARLFAFGSAHTPRDGRSALGSFVRDALAPAAGPIRVAGDGRAVRSYLTGADMADALLGILRRGKVGTAYNLGSDEPVTIADLACKVRDRVAPDREVVVLGQADDGQRSRYVPCTRRLSALTGIGRSDLSAVIDEVAGRV